MQFKINDERLAPHRFPPAVAKAIKVIDALPDGELYTTNNLAVVIGTHPDYLSSQLCRFNLDDRRAQSIANSRAYVFGNKKTIAEYRKVILHETASKA